MPYFPTSATSHITYPVGPSTRGLSLVSGAVNTKGSYVQFVASTGFASNFLDLMIGATTLTNCNILIDIATGAAASETVIIPNILAEGIGTSSLRAGGLYEFVLAIASSTRVACRCQASSGAITVADVTLTLTSAGTTTGAAAYVAYGVSTATSAGTTIDPGATPNTKGSYVEITASTSAISQVLMLSNSSRSNTAPTSGRWSVDIATGAAASEVVLVPDLRQLIGGGGVPPGQLYPRSYTVPTYIAASTRIAVRASSDITDATDRLFAVGICAAVGSGSVYYPASASGLAYAGYPAGPTAGGLTLTPAGSANAKSSYEQIVSSTSFVTNFAEFTNLATRALTRQYLVDIATGAAASETVVVPNLLAEASPGASTTSWGGKYRLPLYIATSTRVALRFQINNAEATDGPEFSLVLMAAGPTTGPTAYATYGADLTDSGGTSVDPGGTIETKGSYVELTASTAEVAYCACVQTTVKGNTAFAGSQFWSVDLATGAAASEVVLIPDLRLSFSGNSQLLSPRSRTVLAYIASGTRLAARASCSVNDATDRLIDVLVTVTATAASGFIPVTHGFTTNGSPGSPLTIYYSSTSSPLYVLLSWFVEGGATDSADRIASVTFNGDALTRGGRKPVRGQTMEWWRLGSPFAGDANVVITPASSGLMLTAGVVNLTGWPSAIVDHRFEATGGLVSLSQPSVTVPSANGNGVIDWLAFNSLIGDDLDPQDVTVGAGQSEVWNQEGTSGSIAQLSAGSTKTASTTTATMEWTLAYNEYWGLAALSYGGVAQQRITQLVLLVGRDEYGDEPPEVDACTGGGTVVAGSDPTDGAAIATATSLHAWIETTINGTTYRWAKVGIPHGNPKTPRVLSFGTLTRALSDAQGGFESSAMSITLSDSDRVLRALHATQTLINQTVSVYVQDEAGIRSGANPWRVFRGVVRDLKPESDLTYTLSLEDPLTLSMSAFAQEKLIPNDTISVSDNTADQGLKTAPAPVMYGSLTDEDDDDPIGTVEAPFVGTETISGHSELGNLHKHLVCKSATHNIQSVFLGDPASGDPPIRRAKAGASEYGTRLYVPHQTGWPLDDQYSVENSKRWTYIYVDQNHPGADLARYGKMPVTVNLCAREATGDATGNTVDSLPLQFLHFLNTEVFNDLGDVDWPAQYARDGYSVMYTTSFTAAKTASEARVSGGYKGAFVLGHGFRQITLRQAIQQFCRSGDFDLGINRHGQIMITMLDRTSTASSAVVFTDQSDIFKDSFTIDPKVDQVENYVRYAYARNYLKTLQQLNPDTGTRLPREPFDKTWLSGEQDVSDGTEITALGETRKSQLQEYEMVRSATTADDVAAQRLALRKPSNGRAEATFRCTLSKGYNVELGAVIKVTHFQGLSSTGWSARRCQVRRHQVNLDSMTCTLVVRDVDNLLA